MRVPNVEDSSGVSRADFAELRTEFSRFMMLYQFGISELMTKVNILKDEFTHINQYSPIEQVTSRVKPPDSILRSWSAEHNLADLPIAASERTIGVTLRPSAIRLHPRMSSRSGMRTERPWIGHPRHSVTFKACRIAMSLRHHIYMGIICNGGEASR